MDDMTKKSLSQTPNQPRIPVFYALTKIHKKNPVGPPIISGCDGPTEQISFIDNILQPIAKIHKSYLKDTTDFIDFIERPKVPGNTILMQERMVTSLYSNIPQDEGIENNRHCMQGIRNLL